MVEIWKDIKGYEGRYQISNLGRVKSMARKNVKNDKILVPQKLKIGYFAYNLLIKSVHKIFYVHRLIAEHFIENPNNYPLVRHLNDIKEDNSISNLAWGTFLDNTNDKRNNGMGNAKERNPMWGRVGEKHHNFGKQGLIGEKNGMFGRTGEKSPMFGKAGKKGALSPNSKIVLDTQTGIFYDCVRDAAEAKGINYNTLASKLSGNNSNKINNTSLIYV